MYQVADMLSKAIDARPSLRSELLLVAPKLLQATFAATMDYYTCRLASKTYGPGSSASIATVGLPDHSCCVLY